jgi:hypothetical protein
MKYARAFVFGVTAAGAAGVAVGAPPHSETGPVAIYWMSASTSTGMGGMGGGQRPSMSQMMNGGFDPNAASHTLTLQLGSQRRPQGDPTAEHDPPPGLMAGPMLPLVTPQAAQPVHDETPPGPPQQYQQPKGRMLIFWGCGEHAGPGQPYVIDFANMGGGNGQAGQQYASLMRNIAINPMQPPSPSRNATYGEWPNQQSTTTVPAGGSLVGDHLVRGDYTPDIRFSLGPDQDFMPAFQMTTNAKNPSGSATLGWQPMAEARGFFATMFGAGGQGRGGRDEGGDTTIVMWTSSQVQSLAFGMPDYLSDSEIGRLVTNHVLMPAGQTECTIPAEAVQAAGESGLFSMTAYGGEVNFAYPERPPALHPWHVDWTVKVRYRSATSGVVGMNLSQMMGGNDDDNPRQRQPQQPPPPQQRPHSGLGTLMQGLGGFVP